MVKMSKVSKIEIIARQLEKAKKRERTIINHFFLIGPIGYKKYLQRLEQKNVTDSIEKKREMPPPIPLT